LVVVVVKKLFNKPENALFYAYILEIYPCTCNLLLGMIFLSCTWGESPRKHLCCQSGNAARHGHPKNWCGVGCGRVAGAISVTRTLIYLILKYYTVEKNTKIP